MIFHNHELRTLALSFRSGIEDLDAVEAALEQHGTLTLTPLETGLYAAAPAASAESGYRYVWVRDNCHIANALLAERRAEEASRIGTALLAYFATQEPRMAAITTGRASAREVMHRPHVRFDGVALHDVSQAWAHAQNDALGYFLWLCARLTRTGGLRPTPAQRQTLERTIDYLAAIEFWDDEDSGHWEEARKTSASSIGVVVAAMEAWTAAGDALGTPHLSLRASALAETLAVRGRDALTRMLPFECRSEDPGKRRRYDAALLFLVYPCEVLDGAASLQVIEDVRRHLLGRIGIRRYPGDSYWAPDYDTALPSADWTRDYSEDIGGRNELLTRPGDEAQWCIFDPVLSAAFGRRWLLTGERRDFHRQVWHLNRSLAQVTGEWQCPELYYLKGGRFVCNPQTPLQWTQANLRLALTEMRRSLTAAGQRSAAMT